MSAANKAKGSRFEVDLEDWLNHEGGLRARRLPRAGNRDIGDVAIELADRTVVIEAKACKTQRMSEWLAEAEVESANYEAKYPTTAIGVVVVKTRMKSIAEARVTMTLENFVQMLHG